MVQVGSFISDKDWRELVDFYFQAKALVALAEISDKEQNLCVAAITELRSALDHLMRVKHVSILEGQGSQVFSVINDDPRPQIPSDEEKKKTYCHGNFLKIKGHIYRAAYDALDILVMLDLSDYEKLTQHFDFDDICQVITKYPTDRAKIEKAQRMVVRCKMYKDIELNDTLEKMNGTLLVNAQVIENYLIAHKTIKEVCKEIQMNILEIRAAVKQRKKTFFMPILIGVFTSLAAAIIISVAVWIVKYLPAPKINNRYTNPSTESSMQSDVEQPIISEEQTSGK